MKGMKHVALVAAAIAVGVATYSAAALSAAPPSPSEKQLLKDVKTLKSQVAKLQKTSKSQTTAINNVANIAVASLAYGACSSALTADAVQGTWQIVDQIAAATQAGQTHTGDQAPIPVPCIPSRWTASD